MAVARITITGLVAEVATPYDPDVVDLIRSIPGRRWNAERRVWTIPTNYVATLTADLEQLGHRVIGPAQRQQQEARRDAPRRDERPWPVVVRAAVGDDLWPTVERALLKALHPDTGGSAALTRQLLDARDRRAS